MSSSRPSSPTATRPAPTSARRSARRIRSRRRRFGQAPSCRPARTTTCQWRPIACAGVRTSTPPGRTPTREIVSMGTEPASSSDANLTAEPAGLRCSHTSATRRSATTASSWSSYQPDDSSDAIARERHSSATPDASQRDHRRSWGRALPLIPSSHRRTAVSRGRASIAAARERLPPACWACSRAGLHVCGSLTRSAAVSGISGASSPASSAAWARAAFSRRSRRWTARASARTRGDGRRRSASSRRTATSVSLCPVGMVTRSRSRRVVGWVAKSKARPPPATGTPPRSR